MFVTQTQIAPARITGILNAATAAARAIPPAFPRSEERRVGKEC